MSSKNLNLDLFFPNIHSKPINKIFDGITFLMDIKFRSFERKAPLSEALKNHGGVS